MDDRIASLQKKVLEVGRIFEDHSKAALVKAETLRNLSKTADLWHIPAKESAAATGNCCAREEYPAGIRRLTEFLFARFEKAAAVGISTIVADEPVFSDIFPTELRKHLQGIGFHVVCARVSRHRHCPHANGPGKKCLYEKEFDRGAGDISELQIIVTLPFSYRIIRCGKDYSLVIMTSPGNTEIEAPGTEYYRYATWQIDDHTPDKLHRINKQAAMGYFRGIADGIGFETPPIEGFSSHEEALSFIKARRNALGRKRLIEVYGIDPDEPEPVSSTERLFKRFRDLGGVAEVAGKNITLSSEIIPLAVVEKFAELVRENDQEKTFTVVVKQPTQP